MSGNWFRVLFISAAVAFCLLSGENILAQCGADGTQPCNQTSRPKTNKPPAKKTRAKTVIEKPGVISNPPKKESFPTIIVKSDQQMIGKSRNGDKLEVTDFEYDKTLEGSKYQGIIAKFKYALVSARACMILVDAYSKGKNVTVAQGGSNRYTGDGEDSNFVTWDRNKIVDEFQIKMIYSDGSKIRTLLVLAVKLKKSGR